jgi:general secretion pathway protein J
MRRGFTLLEVLLAIGLIAALSGGVFAFMWQVVSQKAALTGRAMDGQAGDALLERMEADLAGAVASDSTGNAGIVGTATSLQVLSRGVVLPMEVGDQDWQAGDLQGTQYTFARGWISVLRWDQHRGPGGVGRAAETLSEHIAAMRIRYYDGTEWTETFDSKAKDGLPVAIEVSIWFGTPPEEAATPTPAAERKAPAVGAPVDQDGNPLEVDEPRAEAPELPRPAGVPDRARVMVVPDGPITAWKERR